MTGQRNASQGRKRFLRRLAIFVATAAVVIFITGVVFHEEISSGLVGFRVGYEIGKALEGKPYPLEGTLRARWKIDGKEGSLNVEVRDDSRENVLARVEGTLGNYRLERTATKVAITLEDKKLLIAANGPNRSNETLHVSDLIQTVATSIPPLRLAFGDGALASALRSGAAFARYCRLGPPQKGMKELYHFAVKPELSKGHLELWVKSNGDLSRLAWNKSDGSFLQLELTRALNPSTMLRTSPSNDAASRPSSDESASDWTILEVKRDELEKALARGLPRAAEVLLERYWPPEKDQTPREREGGKLLFIEGNRVAILEGTPRQMGRQHGLLLAREARDMADALLYVATWPYASEKKRWFLDDLREIRRRTKPHTPSDIEEELAGLAETSGLAMEEVELANVFPEEIHCSGFALFGKATTGGRLLHGRVLDYMTEAGFQHRAVLFIYKPRDGYAYANVGYAGFLGAVSGMNEKQIAVGEMGGGGQGNWDGMPMGFLLREVLDKAGTLEEALKIFRETPRTCEYFYVVSDGKGPDARGLACWPDKMIELKPGESHPLLPESIPDAVLMSAGDRYDNLVAKVKEKYGKIGPEEGIRLMDWPVAMRSNLHNVLFAPQTLELWVSNASSRTSAWQEPYTHYSLTELLKE